MARSDIDKAVKLGELVVGLKSVVKGLQRGLVGEVFVSSNGELFVKRLKLVAGSVSVSVLDESSKELGVRCKKPFSIAVLGLRKSEKKPAKKVTKKPAKKVVKKKVTKKPVLSKAKKAKPVKKVGKKKAKK